MLDGSNWHFFTVALIAQVGQLPGNLTATQPLRTSVLVMHVPEIQNALKSAKVRVSGSLAKQDRQPGAIVLIDGAIKQFK